MVSGIVLISGYSAGWNIFKLIVITVLVLILAFYSTKLIAKYQNNSMTAKSNIRFLESYRVGGNKLIAIAKIGERFFALGIGKDEIHVISELKPEELKLPEDQTESPEMTAPDKKASFKDILANMKNSHAKDDSEK
ncbi:MAG: flagellar biosynthetic protein FliO [Wujia sp.]